MTGLISVLFLFFIFFIVIKKVTNKKLCAICFAVSSTWLVFLILFFLGKYGDTLSLAILMGGSAVGLFYYLSSIALEKYYVFKFPFLVTLFWFIYFVLSSKNVLGSEFIILLFLWLFFGLIFLISPNKKIKNIAKSIVECCKNW